MTNSIKLFIVIMCTIEQWVFIIGSIYLIGWKGWNPWWLLLTMLFIAAAAPTNVISSLAEVWE